MTGAMATAADRGSELFVPNLLSFSRVPLAGLLWVAPHRPAWTIGVMLIAGLTDVLDGWLVRRARRRRARLRDPGAFAANAARGAYIDGLADKVFFVSTVALLAWTIAPPLWLIAVLALREVLFVPLMLLYHFAPAPLRHQVDFTAGVPGKLATVAQFGAVVLGLLRSGWFQTAAIAAGFLGAVATISYTVRAFGVER